MNVEIVKELVRQWRKRAEPPAMRYNIPDERYDGSGSNEIRHPPVEQLEEQLRRDTIRQCAQDLDDVIRIYTEFKHPVKSAHGSTLVASSEQTKAILRK